MFTHNKRVATANSAALLALAASLAAASSASAAIIEEFNGPALTWTANTQIGNPHQAGGQFSGTKQGGDPYAYRADFSSGVDNTFNSFESDNRYVYVRMTVPANYVSNAQLYWANPGGTFNTSQNIAFAIVPGTTQTYRVDMYASHYWRRTPADAVDTRISQFRIDPALGVNASDYNGSGFSVDYIRISGSATNESDFVVDNFTSGRTDSWRYVNQVSASVSGGSFHGVSGPDVQMIRDTPDFNGSESTIAHVTMKVDPIEGNPFEFGQLFFATDDTGFSEAKSGQFYPIADGQFHTYDIDFSGNALWTGNVIEQFRLDATSLAGVSYYIDSITVGNPDVIENPLPEPASLGVLALGSLGLLLKRRHAR